MAYLTNRQAPNSGLANLLAMKGRMGDTELVHMSKPEIDILERMGKMTMNPMTGLPEAFSLEEELAGLESLINVPNAKDAMKDLMEFGKEKLKTLTMKEIEKEMPKQDMMMMPPMSPQQMPMPQPQPQQGAIANLRSGGLASFGEEIKRAIENKNEAIEPFLDQIENTAKRKFNINLEDNTNSQNNFFGYIGQQLPNSFTGGLGSLESKNILYKPQQSVGEKYQDLKNNIPMQKWNMKNAMDLYNAKNYRAGMDLIKDTPVYGKPADPMGFEDIEFDIRGIDSRLKDLYPNMSAGRRPKDYFEGQVYDDRGDGMSDDVDFKVDGDPVIKGARLSADEYVLPADLVAMLGNGSSDAGAKKLDTFTKEMRMKAFGTTKQQKPLNATKELKGLI